MTGKIISVVNRKGGVGKTTLAIGIADAFVSEHEAHTCVVDLDPQASASQALLTSDDFATRVEKNRNLFGLIRARIAERNPRIPNYRDGMVHFIRNRGDVGMRLHPNSDRFWDLEADELVYDRGARLAENIQRILKKEAEEDHHVIVDCPPGQSISALAAIQVSDVVLCPITPDRFAIWGKDLLSKYISKNASTISPTFVVTRATLVGREAGAALEKLDGAKEMLRVVAGNDTPGAPDGLARFSQCQRVHNRAEMTEPRTLHQIYGDQGSQELTAIVNAIVRGLENNG